MRLRDSIVYRSERGGDTTLRARVSAKTITRSVDGADARSIADYSIITRDEPPVSNWERDRVVWQGLELFLDGPPMPRMRGGQVHHYTIGARSITT